MTISYPLPDTTPAHGHLSLPAGGNGPGVLLLHPWWGLTPFFRDFADRLASEGFVVLAPDLWDGKTAATIAEAEALLRGRDSARMQAIAEGGLARLQERVGAPVCVVGFSMGAGWAAALVQAHPDAFEALSIFYDDSLFYDDPPAQFPASLRLQAHFGDHDDFVPNEDREAWQEALAAQGRSDAVHVYPGAGHWFLEADRPEHYRADDAARAYDRLVAFLKG